MDMIGCCCCFNQSEHRMELGGAFSFDPILCRIFLIQLFTALNVFVLVFIPCGAQVHSVSVDLMLFVNLKILHVYLSVILQPCCINQRWPFLLISVCNTSLSLTHTPLISATLRALYLSDNDFEILPPDIGKLAKLQIVSNLSKFPLKSIAFVAGLCAVCVLYHMWWEVI